jgi:transcriptional regulator with XRE-family HTH domain
MVPYSHLKNFTPNAQHANADPAAIVRIIPTVNVFVAVFDNSSPLQSTALQCLEKKKKWRIREYRHAYMDAAVEQGVAWQIKINREQRNLTQTELAKIIGSKQSSISRAEDPSYGRHNLETLMKIAHVFDCALQVKFIPYSQLAKDSDDLSPAALYAKSYEEEAVTWKNETAQPKSLQQRLTR